MYQALKRLCVKIDLTENEKSDKTEAVEFVGGCFTNDDIGHYEVATPNRTHSFDYIPIEVRYKLDPYIVFAESHYNLGRDLTLFFWVSVSCLVGAVLLTIILGFCMCGLVQKSVGRRAYAKDVIN